VRVKYKMIEFMSSACVSIDGDTTAIEVWHNHRKISIYLNKEEVTVLRIWGSNIFTEMSTHNIKSATEIVDHIEWLKEEQ